MRVWLAALLCFGCSFSVPAAPGAKQSCIDWYTACRDKALSCGMPVEQSEEILKQWTASCDNVVWSNSDEVYQTCIPALMAAACGTTNDIKCGHFAHL